MSKLWCNGCGELQYKCYCDEDCPTCDKKLKTCINESDNGECLSKNTILNVKNHFCYGRGLHPDDCDCQCGACNIRRKELQQEEFNKKLSEKIQKVFNDSEYRQILVKEIEKIKKK